MEKQTTAMQQLINWIEERDMVLNRVWLYTLLAIEKEQIEDAYQQGYNNAYFNNHLSKEQYYNETFKQD
jgi:hypothetical protein